nr:PREDICTED: uncharacterized protein LOC102279167 [Bos mutus]
MVLQAPAAVLRSRPGRTHSSCSFLLFFTFSASALHAHCPHRPHRPWHLTCQAEVGKRRHPGAPAAPRFTAGLRGQNTQSSKQHAVGISDPPLVPGVQGFRFRAHLPNMAGSRGCGESTWCSRVTHTYARVPSAAGLGSGAVGTRAAGSQRGEEAPPAAPGLRTAASVGDMFSGEQEVAVTGGPAGSAPMKNAVINIQTENPGRDHIVWSLFNTLFMNICCLGFVAFAYSVEVDQKMVGDITGAQSYASTAKCLNVWALVLGLLLTITFITVFGTGCREGPACCILLLPSPACPGSSGGCWESSGLRQHRAARVDLEETQDAVD